MHSAVARWWVGPGPGPTRPRLHSVWPRRSMQAAGLHGSVVPSSKDQAWWMVAVKLNNLGRWSWRHLLYLAWWCHHDDEMKDNQGNHRLRPSYSARRACAPGDTKAHAPKRLAARGGTYTHEAGQHMCNWAGFSSLMSTFFYAGPKSVH
jgi:hypothetical protein